MDILQIFISFTIGILLAFILAFCINLKTKTFYKILINSAVSIAIIIALNYFNIAYIPLNALNCVLIGFLGLLGLLVAFILPLLL